VGGCEGSKPGMARQRTIAAIQRRAQAANRQQEQQDSYSPPRLKPSDVTLTAEQAALARSLGIPYETYAANLLEMEERKRRGDMQL
jgi:hypothetical protein